MKHLSKILIMTALGTLSIAACKAKYPKCAADKDCKEKEFCVQEKCQQCRTTADCPAGNHCEQGRCAAIPDYCGSKADCENGLECIGNRCTTPINTSEDNSTASKSDNTNTGCKVLEVLFEYDSSELAESTRTALSNNARCIKEQGWVSLHLTGHTDPRGTEEYNLALGERRAQAVKAYLRSLGIDDTNISFSSMGEELSSGSHEEGWKSDRKVEFQKR